ncbi:MAG: NAD(P)H-hydrate dehydratase [Celeribacter sp.]
MTRILTSAQMRSTEAAAIACGKCSGAELMERAGQGAADVMRAWFPVKHRHAVILCGPGNNGGDGFVVARHLAQAGWRVEVLTLPGASLSGDAARMADRWEGPRADMSIPTAEAGTRPGLVIDALFGTGLSRPLDPLLRAVQEAVRARAGEGECHRIALDCPSGLSADTGEVVGPDDAPVLPADLTLSFHTPKPGHYLGRGPEICGTLAVVPIGLDGASAALETPPAGDVTRLVAPEVPGPWLRQRVQPGNGDHKYTRGHVLVLGGKVAQGGAARMAARAALRVGAGLVTLAVPPAALIENAARLDAVMLTRCADADALAELLEDTRLSALCLGPGLAPDARTRALVLTALGAERPTVLDAGALSAFADAPEALFAALHPRAVLTPHEGEFARLFPDLAQDRRSGSKIDAVREAAGRAGAVVLLKGAATVIAGPNGATSLHAAVYERAAPWLGTAGAGDVLSGIIAGLIAGQGAEDMHGQVEVAAWLHVEAARRFGPGLIAEDLPDMLPQVFRDHGL